MDYFNDVLAMFLGLEHVSCVAVYGGFRKLSDFIKNILICDLKKTLTFFVSKGQGFTALVKHESE